MMTIRPFALADADAVVALWEVCGLTRPWNDPRADIARKLSVQPELFLVAEDVAGVLVGSVMAGYDGHRGWMNYLAVAAGARGRGVGRALVDSTEQRLAAMGCPKANLQVRAGNAAAVGFYESLGYETDGTIGLGKRLIADAAPDPDRDLTNGAPSSRQRR